MRACVHVCIRVREWRTSHMDAHVDAACVRMLANVHVCMLPKIITRYCGGHVVRVLPKNQLGRQCHSSFLIFLIPWYREISCERLSQSAERRNAQHLLEQGRLGFLCLKQTSRAAGRRASGSFANVLPRGWKKALRAEEDGQLFMDPFCAAAKSIERHVPS